MSIRSNKKLIPECTSKSSVIVKIMNSEHEQNNSNSLDLPANPESDGSSNVQNPEQGEDGKASIQGDSTTDTVQPTFRTVVTSLGESHILQDISSQHHADINGKMSSDSTVFTAKLKHYLALPVGDEDNGSQPAILEVPQMRDTEAAESGAVIAGSQVTSSTSHVVHETQVSNPSSSTRNDVDAALPNDGEVLSSNTVAMESSQPDSTQSLPTSSSTGAAEDNPESVVRYCQVCNDFASGFHYGAWSCEGCKAFFKRSIGSNTTYVCPAKGQCTIDKFRRRSCQACRLQKCFDVGMNRSIKTSSKRKGDGSKEAKSKHKLAEGTRDDTTGIDRTLSESTTSNEIVKALLQSDIHSLPSGHDHSAPATENHIMATITKLADRELVYNINWAKHIPGYTDIPLNDQVSLLEASWMELMVYDICFRSKPYKGEKLAFAPDFILDRHLLKTGGLQSIGDIMLALSAKFDLMALSLEEIVCMKALALITAQLKKLSSSDKIKNIEKQLMGALSDVIATTENTDRFRMSRLFLIMPHVRYISGQGVALFFQMKSEAEMTVLLQEMVTAQFIAQHSVQQNLIQSKAK